MPTLWRYLEAQIFCSPLDAPQIVKHERVYNFVNVPHRLEQVNSYRLVYLEIPFLVFVSWLLDLLGCIPLQFHNSSAQDYY